MIMKKYGKMVLLTLSAGICGGLLMALLLLYMMISTVFTTGGPAFVLELIVAAVLPLCLNIFRNQGIMLRSTQMLMIIISFTVCMYYAGYVTATADFPNMNAAIIVLSAILHGVSLLTVLITAGIRRFILNK
jgi:hypothetical protein